MADWNKKFKPEYDYARSWLKNADAFDEDWRPLVKRLRKLMAKGGFDTAEAECLGDLRDKVKQGPKQLIGHKKVSEDDGILKAVGVPTDDPRATVSSEAKMRAAALKLLRHVYLVNKSGNRKAWVVSLPNDFGNWPSDDIHSRAGALLALRTLLKSKNEQFSSKQRKYLAASTREALAWCQKTGMVLAEAANSGKKGAKVKDLASMAKVKRWFADPATTSTELDRYIGTLSQGFKDITAMLNKGSMILTDWVPFRNATAQDEIDFLNAEAFTFRSRAEGLDVVYIEKSFFVDHPGNVVKGQTNWTRILVHELTHLVCGTIDVVNGRSRYAWYGIGPHAGYPGSQCVQNADNWAFFAADCAGALTDGERKTALKIV